MTWRHFLSDLTIGQVLAVAVGLIGIVNAVLTGAALRNARQAKRVAERLLASVGLLPKDQEHRTGQTLTAQFSNLADEVEKLRRIAVQEKHDEPSVRAGQPNIPQKRVDRL